MITKNRINTPEKALEYMVDCTLATIEAMSLSKTQRKRGEYRRQISIAQSGIDLIRKFGIMPSDGSRCLEVMNTNIGMASVNREVEEWAFYLVEQTKENA